MGDRPRPAVSFLSTAYRTEALVGRMIASVQAQTSPDWQLVVVDNGRSEEMARVVGAHLGDPRIHLVRQDNAGLAGGVNAAGRHATGRYVAVLNSDDTVLPGFVAELVGVLDARPDMTALACDAEVVLEGSRVALPRTFAKGNRRLRDTDRPVALRELLGGFVPYYTALIRAEAWAAVGGYRPADGIEDLVLWLDLVEAGYALHVTDRVLASYSHDQESLSHGAASVVRLEESFERVVDEVATRSGRPEDRAAADKAIRTSRHHRHLAEARRRLRAGDHPGARRSAEDAWRSGRQLRTGLIALGLRTWPGGIDLAHRTAARVRPGWVRLAGTVARRLPGRR